MLIMQNYAVNRKFKCLQYQSAIFGHRERDAPSIEEIFAMSDDQLFSKIIQGRSRRSGRSGHGRTTFSAELIISLLFDSLHSTHIIVQNTLQTVCSDSQLRSAFERIQRMLNDGNISKPCLPNFLPNFWSLQLLHEHIIDALRCHKIC